MTYLEPSPDAPVERPRRSTESRATQVAGVVGKVLIGAGTFVLLFVLFQVFGTSYLQEQHQNDLRNQIDPHHTLATVPATVPTEPPVTVPTIAQPAESTPVAVIAIPKINLNQVVIQGTNEGDLELGPGHYASTPLPGEAGNVGIAGHRTTWGRPFYSLDQLVAGDPIYLATSRGTFVYRVTSSQIVDPSDVGVLNPTTDATLTLTTCNPRYSAAQRLVVHATLASTLTHLELAPATPAGSGKGSSAVLKPAPVHAGTSLFVALLWGLLTAALCVAIWWLGSRRLSKHRWVPYVVGAPIVLVVLFEFFAALSSHLPAGL
jgi:sortase A